MADCSICLINFHSDDEILVFSCDSKHYFHSKCGSEWLEIKPECPLCRKNFKNEIKDFALLNPESGNTANDRRIVGENSLVVQRVSTSTFLQDMTQRMNEHQQQINREEGERGLLFRPLIIFGNNESPINHEPNYRSLYSMIHQQNPSNINPSQQNPVQSHQNVQNIN